MNPADTLKFISASNLIEMTVKMREPQRVASDVQTQSGVSTHVRISRRYTQIIGLLTLLMTLEHHMANLFACKQGLCCFLILVP